MDAGIDIYENNFRMAHTKIFVVDKKWVSIGSFNLNHRSVDHDFELNLVIDSESFAKRVIERIFEPHMNQVNHLTKPYHIKQNIIDWFLVPFS